MTTQLRSCWIIWLCVALAHSSVSARQWHRDDGKLVGEGKLINVKDGRAVILADGDVMLSVPIKTLSLEDAAYVQAAIIAQRRAVSERVNLKIDDQAPGPETSSPTEAGKNREPSDRFALTDPNAIGWQARPDPAPWNWTEALDDAALLRLPAFSMLDGIVLPASPSPYVALSASRGEFRNWDRWDLRTGERAGVARNTPRPSGKRTMSPDGKLLSLAANYPGDVEIWSLETGRRLAGFKPGEKSSSVGSLLFVAGDGLVVGHGSRYDVFNAATGGLRAGLPSSYLDYSSRIAVSPGGHYAAVVHEPSSRLAIFDLRNGAVAGEAILPDIDEHNRRCGAIGFSTDGTKPWTLLGRSSPCHLLTWNVADGKLQSDVKFDSISLQLSAPGEYDIPDFAEVELPGVRGLLLNGKVLLDPEKASVMWVYEPDATSRTSVILRVIGKSQFLIANTERGNTRLSLLPDPSADIKASHKLIATGGTVNDAGLPPLTVPNWEGVARLSPIEDAKESYQPAPVELPVDPPDRIKLVLKNGSGELAITTEFALAGGRSNLCALLNSIQSEDDTERREVRRRIDVFDLVSGQLKSQTPIPRAFALLDISPDGSSAVVGSTSDGRIDLWDLRNNEHRLGFRPVRDENERIRTRSSGRPTPVGCHLENGQLLTAGFTGELAVWHIDGCKPIYSLSTLNNSIIALDSSCKHFLAQDVKGIRVCRVADGKAVATLAASQLPSGVILRAAAFRSDGEAVAMHVASAAVTRLVVWDLVRGNVQWETALPFVVNTIAWSGDDLLLGGLHQLQSSMMSAQRSPVQNPSAPDYERQTPDLNNAWSPEHLLSIIRVSPIERRFVWSYRTQSPAVNLTLGFYHRGGWHLIGQTAGNRAWIASRESSPARVLVSLPGRTSHEKAAIDAAIKKTSAPIRGDAVTLHVEVGRLPQVIARGAERRAELQKRLEETFKKRLAEHTFETSSKEALTLRVTLDELPARDLVAADGKSPVALQDRLNLVRSNIGAEALGVLARVELLKNNDDEKDGKPVWLLDGWFASPRNISPVGGPVQQEL